MKNQLIIFSMLIFAGCQSGLGWSGGVFITGDNSGFPTVTQPNATQSPSITDSNSQSHTGNTSSPSGGGASLVNPSPPSAPILISPSPVPSLLPVSTCQEIRNQTFSLSVQNVQLNSADLSWQNLNLADGQFYRLYLNDQVIQNFYSSNTYNLSGLQANTTYSFAVALVSQDCVLSQIEAISFSTSSNSSGSGGGGSSHDGVRAVIEIES